MSAPLRNRPKFVSQDDWKRYAERVTVFGRHLLGRGIRLAYHHHMGAYVQAPEDVDTLMSLTGEEVGLLFDTGHATFGGGDAVAMLAKHVRRVCHVHCKDVRLAVMQTALNRGWSFLQSVLNGVFTVPGDGGVDFAGVLGVLDKASYRGWLVVEAEQDPAVAPPYAYAKKGFETLTGLVRGLAAGGRAS
jgi:inosose dehydratase